jgi:hypothetical protein
MMKIKYLKLTRKKPSLLSTENLQNHFFYEFWIKKKQNVANKKKIVNPLATLQW